MHVNLFETFGIQVHTVQLITTLFVVLIPTGCEEYHLSIHHAHPDFRSLRSKVEIDCSSLPTIFEDNRLQLLPTSFATNSRMLLLHVPITVRIGSDKHQSFAFITRAGADERRYRERVTTARVASFSQMRTSQRLHGPSFTSLCAETPHGEVRFSITGGKEHRSKF